MLLEFFSVYIIFISLLSIIICIFDKYMAKIGGRRVSERALFTLCAFGGSLAMYITMRVIRHKTRHKKFMIGIPIIIFIQFMIFIPYYWKFL